MRARKYPLEPLVGLRQRKVDESAGDLAAAVKEREAATQALAQATQRRDQAAKAVGAARLGELDALGRGQLRAADLARADAWGVRVAIDRAALMTAVEGARATETDACAEERQARATVATNRAQVAVVEKHRTRWDDAHRRAVEAAEEEAAADARRPKT